MNEDGGKNIRNEQKRIDKKYGQNNNNNNNNMEKIIII